MNNEPVAIVNTNCENNIQWYDDNPKKHNGYFLYTKPLEPQVETKMQKLEKFNGVYQLGFDDGLKAGMQRAVEINLVKKLSEWEIKECWEEATEMQEHFCSQYFDFAQLILRKAQEK
jgi:hypothetical protein